MRSSTTPPASSQHSVYCADPGWIRRTSLVRQALTKSAAPGPVTEALPRWLTSKTPTRSRTAVCSATTPPPGYSIRMSQPPQSAILTPRATWRSCRGEVNGEVAPEVAVVMGANLPLGTPADPARYHSSGAPDPRDALSSCARKHLDKGVPRGQPDHLEPLGCRHPGRRPRRGARAG